MPRTRSYDEDAVLTGAMHAFRRSGYSGLSIGDLEAATGISSGSIYNSWTDKRGLFLAAFAHYLEAVLARRMARFAGPEHGLLGLRELFLSLLKEPDGGTFGCLITNTAIEFAADAPLIDATVRKGFGRLEQLFLERLQAARAAGVLTKGLEPKSAAVKLLALYQGVLVLVRGGHDLRSVRRAIQLEFDMMEEGAHGA